jgi:hypothetical protein
MVSSAVLPFILFVSFTPLSHIRIRNSWKGDHPSAAGEMKVRLGECEQLKGTSLTILIIYHLVFDLKYVIMSRHPNSGQNQNIRTADESFENVAKFKYLGTTLTNQNDIRDEIRVDKIRGMLAIIQSKIFCLPVSYQKT